LSRGTEVHDGISDRIVHGITKNFVWLVDDNAEIEYQSAKQATELVLSLAFAGFMFSWFIDIITGYELPNTAYGIAISAPMSIVFVATEISNLMNSQYDTPLFDNIQDPITYQIVIKYCGMVVFFLGFMIQITVLYFASAFELTRPIIAVEINQIGTLVLTDIFTGLFIIIGSIAFVEKLGIYEFIRTVSRHIFLPSMLTTGGAAVAYQFYGMVGAYAVAITAIFVLMILYTWRLLKLTGEFLAHVLRIAHQPRDQILDQE